MSSFVQQLTHLYPVSLIPYITNTLKTINNIYMQMCSHFNIIHFVLSLVFIFFRSISDNRSFSSLKRTGKSKSNPNFSFVLNACKKYSYLPMNLIRKCFIVHTHPVENFYQTLSCQYTSSGEFLSNHVMPVHNQWRIFYHAMSCQYTTSGEYFIKPCHASTHPVENI